MPRAGIFIHLLVWMTSKNASPAGGVAGARGMKRTRNGQRLQMRRARPIEIVHGTADIRLQPRRFHGIRILQKSHHDIMRTGLHRNANAQARIHRIARVGGLLKQRRQIFLAAHGSQMNAPAIQRKFNLMGRLQAAHDIQIGSIQGGLERILAIQRKIVVNHGSAHGSERQTIDVLVL